MVEFIIVVVSLLFTLLTTLIVIVVSLLATVLPFVLIGGIIWWQLKNGGGVVISGPLVQGLAAASAPPAPKVNLVKVSTCKACGAHRTTPSVSAYVHCDQCGQLTDWDFRAAMSDKRSKAPGPAYVSLLQRSQTGLAKALADEDRDAYTALQKEIWEAYARLCPAACPPRIGDERYRAQWVDWTSRAQTEQDLDSGCTATFAAQQVATSALKWDRSNPFQPMAELESYRALLAAVMAHQDQVVSRLESTGLLAEHPDHPDPAVFRSIGTAAFVQGWLSFLPKSEHQATLEATGLDSEYIEPPAVDLTKGECPCCGAPLTVPANAKRVVCIACGHGVSVKGGTLPCLGCGSSIEIPEAGTAFVCPFCDLRVERLGLR